MTIDIQDIINNLAKTLCKEDKLHDELEQRLQEQFQENVTVELCTSTSGDGKYSYEIGVYVDTVNAQIKKQMEQLFACEVTEGFGKLRAEIEGTCDNL